MPDGWSFIPAAGPVEKPDWLNAVEPEPRATIEANLEFVVSAGKRAPYLAELCRKHPEFLADLLDQGPDHSAKICLEDVTSAGTSIAEEAELGAALRDAKGHMALTCALAEIGGRWTTEQATRALSDLADASLHAGLEFLIARAIEGGKFSDDAQRRTASDCGLAVFALGKHGGQELNYSSDIDIVAFFDRSADVLAEPGEASKTWSRIVQRLAALMEDRTEHGYVFRTDLRLRPDPGSTPVALSTDAALTYYESRGQNWERAAWIKARPCAGDLKLGTEFLAELAPFVWRKHLDFVAIADIQAMKRQINIARNVGGLRLAGHNVKLGRGGIREIEFFTQTQQLIAGGREPGLRVRPTSSALAALAEDNWISRETADQLTKTYWFLRAVENRVQMQNDEQTHILPEDDSGLSSIAALMGYEDLAEFETDYRAALDRVTDSYTNLFTEGTSLSSQTGDLVFTGTDDDPGTLDTLTSMGFNDPQKASALVRKWHYGSYAATRSATSRAHLTELLPVLLETFAEAGNADVALANFDNFLSRLPAGVQFFAMLRSHNELCRLLVAFMASAPKMAEAVIRRAHILDGLIDPTRSEEVVDPVVLSEKLNSFLDEADGFEDLIDRARILGQEHMFLISAGLISGAISAQQAGRQFTTIADTLLSRLFEDTRKQLAERHGYIEGARVALVGFGRLGSRDLSVSSDLDIILLYDVPEGEQESDGAKPLGTVQYFTRLTQRLIAAISAPTATGVLYEVDMRLRPSGNAGPVATSLSAFDSYQAEKAWTWEHLALSRARVICADPGFGDQIDQMLDEIFARPRDRTKVLADVLDMRMRLLKDRPPRHPFDLKLADGGLMDLDFIAQSAVLLDGATLRDVRGDTEAILRNLGRSGVLVQGETLADDYAVMAGIVQVMSACLTNPFKPEGWTDAFKSLLARTANSPDFARLESDVDEMKARASAAFADWVRTG